jgi:hypothetical protein
VTTLRPPPDECDDDEEEDVWHNALELDSGSIVRAVAEGRRDQTTVFSSRFCLFIPSLFFIPVRY